MLLGIVLVHLFLLIDSIPLYVYLLILLLVDTCCRYLYLFQIMPLGNPLWMHPDVHVHEFLRVELLIHRIYVSP